MFFHRREGTTFEQDHLNQNVDDAFIEGGSTVDVNEVKLLVNNLAARIMSISKMNGLGMGSLKPLLGISEFKEKREKIRHPEQDVKKKVKNATFSKDVHINNTNVIDSTLADAIVERFHMRPYIGMNMACKVNGKTELLKGTLQYLGHLDNLPKKKNIVVAGLRLEKDEDLGTDGSFLGKRYFKAPSKRGYFIPFKNCAE